MKLNPHYFYFASLVVLAAFTGCKDKQEIKVYRVSKAEVEAPPAAPMAGAGGSATMPGTSTPGWAHAGLPADPGSELTGTAPANWEAQAPSSMRQASYLVKGENGAIADVSLVVLGGGAGGALDNVNRWLGQLSQLPVTEEKLQEMAKHITSPLGDVTIVDLEGLPPGADAAKDGRILAGFVITPDKTVFFKMRGNAALVESQREAFTKWAGTVQSTPAGSTPTMPAMAATPTAPVAEAVETGKPQVKWEAPDGWKSVTASSMRYASFSVTGANDETGDVAVSVFPGETGGDLANVNRWRGQVGLEPVAESDLKSVVTKVGGKEGEIMVVDLTGQKSRLLAGWTRSNGNAWFFKLTGSDDLVGGEKEKFLKFLQSVQFNP